MVVPDSAGVLQPQADHGSSTSGLIKNSAPGYEEEDQELAGVELEEVRKLQELVRRLEVQNQSLRNRGKNIHHGGATNSNHPVGSNINKHLSCDEVTNAPLSLVDRVEELSSRDFELSPPLDSNSCKDMSPLPQTNRLEEDDGEDEDGSACEGFLTLPCCNGGQGQGQILEQGCLTPDSPSLDSYESETMAESDSGVDQSALDEVDVLDLEEEGVEVEDEDSWLYVSPKKQIAKPGPESPLKWCRKVLDHPSPETEVACRTLINRLDQRYMSIHSALSSQSSIDSELSTSDDSISMGYKLQDLTDVQIMARLQEDSLRQDYASSSASVSRRSSSASLQSLRRGGTYSDQEFDSYSLEDEEDACCSLPQRRPRYSPSPLGSPRCLSPSTQGQGEYHQSRLGATRTRAPRRSLQGPSPELLKFAKSEEELRHSMPNLAPRTSLRTLEAVRNSRSMEANLQSSGGRMSRLTHSSPSSGVNSSRLRSSGQSPLSLRAPVKAIGPVSSMTGVRQPSRGLPVVQNAGPTGGVRRVQSPGQSNSGAYPSGRAMPEAGRPTTARGQVGTTPTPGGRVSQTPRSLGISSRGPMLDESWKEGCY
ncbi:SLAIN motif-containing protein-like isoform X3 [Hypomesus transpacificus]|uniref:SLAIN motif-containing protein-like isoform X3 n=1 Tax=Hypomesus transpacificus TaxID=137520 RepID=UPI001F08722A|nr:SLAIN motif-containing protein-like isoform X3 [Hypomesus transpacificus]